MVSAPSIAHAARTLLTMMFKIVLKATTKPHHVYHVTAPTHHGLQGTFAPLCSFVLLGRQDQSAQDSTPSDGFIHSTTTLHDTHCQKARYSLISRSGSLPFQKGTRPQKINILQGYVDGSYSATLKKRCEDCTTFLALSQ